MIDKKRVFFMHAAQVGQNANQNNNDIILIDERSEYWKRERIPENNNEPDMSMIKTNIQKKLTSRFENEEDEQFRIDFPRFGEYFEKYFENRLSLLEKVFK